MSRQEFLLNICWYKCYNINKCCEKPFWLAQHLKFPHQRKVIALFYYILLIILLYFDTHALSVWFWQLLTCSITSSYSISAWDFSPWMFISVNKTSVREFLQPWPVRNKRAALIRADISGASSCRLVLFELLTCPSSWTVTHVWAALSCNQRHLFTAWLCGRVNLEPFLNVTHSSPLISLYPWAGQNKTGPPLSTSHLTVRTVSLLFKAWFSGLVHFKRCDC